MEITNVDTEMGTVFISPFRILANIALFLDEDMRSGKDSLEYILLVRKGGEVMTRTSFNIGEEDAERKLLTDAIEEIDTEGVE